MKNTAMNEHTGDQLISGHATDAYRDGYASIFGDKTLARYNKYVTWCNEKSAPYMSYEGFAAERDQEPRWTRHEWEL